MRCRRIVTTTTPGQHRTAKTRAGEPAMTLTPEQVHHFRTHGYLAMPQFFSPRETAGIQAEVERLKREGHLRNVATDGDGKTTSQTMQNLQLCPMYRQSPLF